jgi:hypothetical protein
VSKIFGLAWLELTGNWRKLHNDGFNYLYYSPVCVFRVIQGNQNVSVHHHHLPHYFAQSDCLAADRQVEGDTRLTLTPSVFLNSYNVIMVSDWNCLKYFGVFCTIVSCTDTF